MSNFAMGIILGKGFPQAQVHTVHSTSAFYLFFQFSFVYRSTLQYTSSQTPFLPTRNNLIQKSSVSAGGARSPHGFSEKNFKKCSWRCIAIFFVVLAVILSAALAYITGKFLISQFSTLFY